MEARKIKPTGGIYGEEIAVTATPEEWQGLIDHIWRDQYCLTDDSKGWELIQILKGFGVND